MDMNYGVRFFQPTSVMAYERLTEKYPSEPVLYSELAQAYMALEDRVSAERAMASHAVAESQHQQS